MAAVRILYFPVVLVLIAVGAYLFGSKGVASEAILYGMIPFVLVAIIGSEVLFPYRKNVEPSTWKRDFLYIFISLISLAVLGTITVKLLTLVLNQLVGRDQLFLPNQLGPFWLQALVAAVGLDGMRYGIHRAQHKFPFLWNFHAQHHSVKKIYSLNGYYSHPFDLYIRHGLSAYVFMLIGFEPLAFVTGVSVIAAIGMFSHCSAELNFGILNKFISTPQVHRWHHAEQFGAEGKNFAPSLAIWDQIFGTYYFEENSLGPEVMGLGREEEQRHPINSAWDFAWSPFLKIFKAQ